MTSILITGNTKLLTQEVLDILLEDYRVVVSVDEEQEESAGREGNLHVYRTDPMEEKFRQLFIAYGFQMVCYLGGYADGGEGMFGELQQLEQTLKCCSEFAVEKVVFLSTIESCNAYTHIGEEGQILGKEYGSDRALLAAQEEELCNYYARKRELKVLTLWCHYLAGQKNEYHFLGKTFDKLIKGEKIVLPFGRREQIDFLSMRDLGRLLGQIIEETEDESGSFYAISGYMHTGEELRDALCSLVTGKVEIDFAHREGAAQFPQYPAKLRRQYGFIPMDDVVSDLGEYYRLYREEVRREQRKGWRERLENAGGMVKKLFPYVEVLLVFLLVEILAGYSSESVSFKVVDVRVIFIMIAGSMYGMQMGVLAAVLECAVLVQKYAAIGMDAVMLFYNVENWVPFVYYIAAGSISGYLSDKKTGEIQFAEKEKKLLEIKYVFLNRVYLGVLENRREYKKQILGFQDSFGKIFDAVQRLEGEMAGSIFLKGLQVMEENLHNHAIAIYTLDSWQNYGRLAVCSNSWLHRLTKSIRMAEYQEVYDTVKRGDVYCNTEFCDGMPAYAYSVMRDEKIALLIFIWEAEDGQYSMYYRNIFRILCGLIQTAFLHALDYEEAKRKHMYYEGTGIVRPEYFHQNLKIQEEMKMAGVSDFVLVRLLCEDKEALNEKIGGMVRGTDILGEAQDHRLYLILTQSRRENFAVVGKRLRERGIAYELVEELPDIDVKEHTPEDEELPDIDAKGYVSNEEKMSDIDAKEYASDEEGQPDIGAKEYASAEEKLPDIDAKEYASAEEKQPDIDAKGYAADEKERQMEKSSGRGRVNDG